MEPTVIYIMGDVRSGTTLIDYLLSCHPDAVSVGEMDNLNVYYCRTGDERFHHWQCSCNKYVQDCSFWSPIIKQVNFSDDFETKLTSPAPKLKHISISSKLHREDVNKALNDPKYVEKGKQVAHHCWQLYRQVFEKSGKSIIVDSSKKGFQAYFLNKYREGNIRFVLIERELGAVAYSKLRHNRDREVLQGKKNSIYNHIIKTKKVQREHRILAQKMNQHNKNDLNTADGKTVFPIDYFELASDPAETIDQVTSWLKVSSYVPPASTNTENHISPTSVTKQENTDLHIIGGSGSRYVNRKIKPDLKSKSYYRKKPMIWLFKNSMKTIK